MTPRDPRNPDCVIDGCTRAQTRSGLCRVHQGMVPRELPIECMKEIMLTNLRIGQKWRRRYIAAVRKALREAS
jgi:hypothetical protein